VRHQQPIVAQDGALGTLEDNEIAGNGYSGVEIRTGGNPVLRRNQIRGNQAGVYVHDNGQGTLEDNEITGNGERKGVFEDNDLTGNGSGAWDIANDCKPNVTRARNAE
jgi:parallel beta-helix repeat protein